ncbi:MAG: NUDIX domain-containing protein [Pseudomonadota bacterium]
MNKQNLRYCPNCGSDGFRFDGFKKYICGACEFVFFFNPAAAVAAVIIHDDKLLTAVRAQDPGAGKLDLPGGFVDPGEAADTALIRELREEIGAEPIGLSYFCSSFNVYDYKNVEYTICDIFYLCELTDYSALIANDDVADLRWIAIDDLSLDDFAFVSSHAIVKKLQAN